mgnify:FL=1
MLSHGDMAYIPSSVTLWQTSSNGNPNKTKKTEKPQLVLVADSNMEEDTVINGRRKVLIYGEYWMVETKNLYPCSHKDESVAGD